MSAGDGAVRSWVLFAVGLDVLAVLLVAWASWAVHRARTDTRRAKLSAAGHLADAQYWRSIAMALVTPTELYEYDASAPVDVGRVAGGVVEQQTAELSDRAARWLAGGVPSYLGPAPPPALPASAWFGYPVPDVGFVPNVGDELHDDDE